MTNFYDNIGNYINARKKFTECLTRFLVMVPFNFLFPITFCHGPWLPLMQSSRCPEYPLSPYAPSSSQCCIYLESHPPKSPPHQFIHKTSIQASPPHLRNPSSLVIFLSTFPLFNFTQRLQNCIIILDLITTS
jgi:hypothetical protein